MTTDQETQAVATWARESTTTREIESALAALWRSTAQEGQPSAESPQAVQRTSVMNLIVYAASRGVSERAAAAIAHLASTHPSRSLLVLAEPEAPLSGLGASLKGLCRDAGEGRRFCFERIDITARGDMVERLPGIITQLTIHDLPAVLWWPGDPSLASPFFQAMAGTCDWLIVDSSDFRDPEAELGQLANFARARKGHFAVRDLNWDRLVDWRELIAQFFDGSTMQPYLAGIHALEIDYAFDSGGQRNSAQGLLLAAWLATRLGWSLEHAGRDRSGGYELGLFSLENPVEVRIAAATDCHIAPGSVHAVTIHSEANGSSAIFRVAIDDGEHATTSIEVEGGSCSARTVQLEPRAESALLSEEFEALGREGAYDDALQAAGGFAARSNAR